MGLLSGTFRFESPKATMQRRHIKTRERRIAVFFICLGVKVKNIFEANVRFFYIFALEERIFKCARRTC